jgi:OPA family hexose phosphate transport protein UhpT-like MFS transporter
VALFGANYLFDGHVIGMFIFPSIIALIVGFIGLRFGSDSRNLTALAKLKSCLARRSAKRTKKPKKTR